MSILVGLASGCVMPRHRGVATFCNSWMFGGGFVIAAMVPGDDSSSNWFRDFDHAASDFAAAVMLLAITGEVLTVVLHHDAATVAAPVR